MTAGAAPQPRCRRPGFLIQYRGDDPLRAARHLLRRAAREGEKQDALRAHALQDEVRDAVRECFVFPVPAPATMSKGLSETVRFAPNTEARSCMLHRD